MKNIVVLLFAAMLNVLSALGQVGSVGVSMTYNYYSLDNIRAFQKDINTSTQFPTRIVENFPAYYGVKLSYTNSLLNQKFTVFAAYNSTGGRIAYSDYSGGLLVDQILNIYTAGLNINLPMHKGESFALYFSPGIAVSYARYDIRQEFHLSAIKEKDQFAFESSSMGAGLSISLEKRIKFFTLKAEIGGDIYLGSALKFTENGYNLINKYNRNVKCQLTGVRSEIGLLINFDSLF